MLVHISDAGTGKIEVKVKTKQELQIYIMWALQYIHDNLLNDIAFPGC